jgi:hypothetical protein
MIARSQVRGLPAPRNAAGHRLAAVALLAPSSFPHLSSGVRRHDEAGRIRRRVHADDTADLGAHCPTAWRSWPATMTTRTWTRPRPPCPSPANGSLPCCAPVGTSRRSSSSGTGSPRPATRSSPAPSRPPSVSSRRPGWPREVKKATAGPATGHPPSPIRTPTMPATVKRAPVVERAWHDPPGSVLDRGLAEPAYGTSHVALVGLVVTDLRTAPRKEGPHERCASPPEPGGRSAMLDEWSR